MTITELFVLSNQELRKVIEQIKPEQWYIQMPEGSTRKAADIATTVRYHTYDDAWVPDTLAGKTFEEVGTTYEWILSPEVAEITKNYIEFNQRAIEVVSSFTDLEREVHLSYGDYHTHDYLQHVVSFRAFRSYTIAKLIDADSTMNPVFVQALLDEFEPVIGWYREVGVFPAPLEVADDADPQTRLLAMVGMS